MTYNEYRAQERGEVKKDCKVMQFKPPAKKKWTPKFTIERTTYKEGE